MAIAQALLKNPKDTFLRWLTYFRRGHTAYLTFLISFANFIVIQYRLLIQHIPALQVIFSGLLAFTIVFFLMYVPISTLIGWWDYKKFAVPMESRVKAQASPWTRDLAKALTFIAMGENEKAIKILEKWAKQD